MFESKKIIGENYFFIFLPNREVLAPLKINLDTTLHDLKEIDNQKDIVLKNTINFVSDLPSTNILLWGAKGMGKSTLIKCVVKHLNNELSRDLKLVEILNNDIEKIVEVVYELSLLNHKFLIYIDDISFKNDDKDFRLFKSLVEGSLLSHSENIRYYITSNLRHLSHDSNSNSLNDLQEKELSQNLISLSDRFGHWLGFYDINQEKYLSMVKYYLKKKSIKYTFEHEKKALQWSLEKGNFSGRTANQFIKTLVI